MKILLKSLNYAPELTGIGKYNGEMCRAFAKRGIDTTAIVAPPYYPQWEVNERYKKYAYATETLDQVTVVRCPLYVPKTVTTLKRIVHLFSFSLSAGAALFARLFNRPDVIILVQPTLFCAPATLLFAKLTGAKTVLHIQDYELDALFGLGMMAEGRKARWARLIEKWLMKRFDAISTISYSMIENAKTKGVDKNKIIHFPNWSDTKFVTPDTDGSALKAQWGFQPEDKIILYAGNIGMKQGLEIVIEAAKSFASQAQVKFVFVGAGAYIKQLKLLAQASQLDNVFFKPLQPWELVPQMLALADLHLVIQRVGAADAVLPSKLTNILSVGGHTIVTAGTKTELGRIAQQHAGIFELIEPESATALVLAIKHFFTQDISAPNQVARDFAVQYLNKDIIIDNFVSELGKLTLLGTNIVNEGNGTKRSSHHL